MKFLCALYLALGGAVALAAAPVPEVIRGEFPGARQVIIRHSGTSWAVDYALAFTNGGWQTDTAALAWEPGHYQYKFVVDGVWQEGANRYAYVDPAGRLRSPPALYLTWQRDPATTMTIHWHGDDAREPARVTYRVPDTAFALTATGTSRFLAAGLDRYIHTVELTNLTPGQTYTFQAGSQSVWHSFRTLPARLEEPLRFIEGGDVYEIGAVLDAMNRRVGTRDPAFVILGGDLAYADGGPEKAQRWLRFFASFYENLRAPDGRLIPLVVAIGNHEVQNHYLETHADYQPGPDWREKVAPHFYALFAFPGHPGYNVLDVGDYLSLVILDSGLTSPLDGEQLDWLKQTLATRRHVPHLFPIYHIPAYPSVRSPHEPRSTFLRQVWVPQFEQAGVRLAFEHHDHAFKVTHPMRGGRRHPDGIVFAGDGAWGVGLRVPADPPPAYLRKALPIHHFFEVTLTATNRSVVARDLLGAELDAFTQPLP